MNVTEPRFFKTRYGYACGCGRDLITPKWVYFEDGEELECPCGVTWAVVVNGDREISIYDEPVRVRNEAGDD